jgi:hypothetical protein
LDKVFYQGYLDSLCGIYSIVNANKIVNNPSDFESQSLFNKIIEFLDKRKILKEVLLEGTNQTIMRKLIKGLCNSNFPLMLSDRKNFNKLDDWWNYSKGFIEEGSNRTIILSLGGKLFHLTVVERMTDKTIYLKDSSYGWRTIKKSMCRLAGYPDSDKYIIYPSQCWYVGKE